MTDSLPALRAEALAIYQAALHAVDPDRAVRQALSDFPAIDRVWVIALGKAAAPMAAASVRSLGNRLIGGLIVAPESGPPIDGRLVRYQGDHPEPGPGSAAAASGLAALIERIGPADTVLVLLSGGTTSLIGAPAPGLSAEDYAAVFRAAWRAGLPIGAMNRIRKRFSRWGAGRLAAALPTQPIYLLAISDVPGDDLADIGSGPCSPDPTSGEEIDAAVVALPFGASTRAALRRWLATPGARPPYCDAGLLSRVRARVIASNRIAVAAAASTAHSLGYRVTHFDQPIEGEARLQGEALAIRLRQLGTRAALIAGGETTVTLGATFGIGGRCQELALAAAAQLAGDARDAVLLAAGTDGRDGPTDAAGAIVDQHTWQHILERGIDPTSALQDHNGYPALASAAALVRVGATGTNVADITIGLTGS